MNSPKKWSRPRDEPCHEVAIVREELTIWSVPHLCGRDKPGFEIVHVHHITWNVDAISFKYVAADILPMVGELKSGADRITVFERRQTRLYVGKLKYQPPHRISAPAAIANEVFPCVVPRLVLILNKGIDQGEEEIAVKRMPLAHIRQRHEHRMAR